MQEIHVTGNYTPLKAVTPAGDLREKYSRQAVLHTGKEVEVRACAAALAIYAHTDGVYKGPRPAFYNKDERFPVYMKADYKGKGLTLSSPRGLGGKDKINVTMSEGFDKNKPFKVTFGKGVSPKLKKALSNDLPRVQSYYNKVEQSRQAVVEQNLKAYKERNKGKVQVKGKQTGLDERVEAAVKGGKKISNLGHSKNFGGFDKLITSSKPAVARVKPQAPKPEKQTQISM